MEKLQIGPKIAYVIKFDAPELFDDLPEYANNTRQGSKIDLGETSVISAIGEQVAQIFTSNPKKLPGSPPDKNASSTSSKSEQKTAHALEESPQGSEMVESYSDESEGSYDSESESGSDDEKLLNISNDPKDELDKT